MTLELQSPCKINLLLNILGKRPDGFHELETVMQPISYCDRLRFSTGSKGITLTCDEPTLPTDGRNLVCRAAAAFFNEAKLSPDIHIHLEKRIPLAAGLGGGSANAATTLTGLNELHQSPLSLEALQRIASSLGSDVPFFLQRNPALATGRGEKVESLRPFAALSGCAVLLIHPGFGISTPWAYQNLASFPAALHGRPGRARELITLLQSGELRSAGAEFYNSLEAPALRKYPLLALFQEFLREHGAAAALMSGSGSTTFAITQTRLAAESLNDKFKSKFGLSNWLAVVDL